MVSIATWNVENLFTPNADSGPDGAAEFAAKADALAATITAMDPDVLALQEIGDPEALDDVLGRVGGTWHVETADPDGRGIRVAIAARTPLSQVYQVGPFLDGLRPVQVDDTAAVMYFLPDIWRRYEDLENAYRNEVNFRTLTVAGRPAFVEDERNLSGTQTCQLWVSVPSGGPSSSSTR